MKIWTMVLLVFLLNSPLVLSASVDNTFEREGIDQLASWEGVELSEFSNVRDYGVKGDGSTDDTNMIQALIDDKEYIYFPDGVYLINVERALNLRSKQVIHLSDEAILKALPSDQGYTAVLRLDNVSDVHISGGQIIGERYSHTGETGEWGMGIQVIKGSHTISIRDIKIYDCWGDGIFLGDSPTVSDILITDVICDNNRRQGLSISDANGIMVRDSVFINTNGTLPEAGIDIEPDPDQTSENIQLLNVQCLNNNGSGLDLMGLNGLIDNILIEDSRFSDNIGPGIRFFDVGGDVKLKNLEINDNCPDCPKQIERNNPQRFKQIITMIFDYLKK